MRQGDPLSPLLFVVAADFLQSIINDASSRVLISHSLGSAFGGDFPIVQYATDALLFLKADVREFFLVKGLLRSFVDSTGLQINFTKSSLVPINLTEEKA